MSGAIHREQRPEDQRRDARSEIPPEDRQFLSEGPPEVEIVDGLPRDLQQTHHRLVVATSGPFMSIELMRSQVMVIDVWARTFPRTWLRKLVRCLQCPVVVK